VAPSSLGRSSPKVFSGSIDKLKDVNNECRHDDHLFCVISYAGACGASPWMWAKARSKLGALIRPCGDGVVLNVARMGSCCMEIHPFCIYIGTNGPFVPTHHRTADAQRWLSHLAMDVGEGQK
jgi:hypothetical protein